jgi:hypothetical protein
MENAINERIMQLCDAVINEYDWKGVLKDYEHSKFIVSVDGDALKFEMNIATPFFIKDTRHKLFAEYAQNAKLENAIPIEDARWMGEQMARLTP